MSTVTTKRDPRLEAFLSSNGPAIFRHVVHWNEVWSPDPFDVEMIFPEAREKFQRLVTLATRRDGNPIGRMLLVRGEAGSGKTHLMRAFRRYVHGSGNGYFAYMQMTSSSGNYGRYILLRIVESLDQPYYLPEVTINGWMRLANAVVDSPAIDPDDLKRLRLDDLSDSERNRLVDRLANLAMCDNFLNKTPIDLIQAMLLLQCENPTVRQRVMKYLRGDELHSIDRDKLAGISSKHADNGPEELIAWIGKLIWDVQKAALVICLDQFEDQIVLADAKANFPSLARTVRSISEQLPHSVVVLSCISDYYQAIQSMLDAPLRDRIEKNPSPEDLKAQRTPDEIVALVETQLAALDDYFDIPLKHPRGTHPLDETAIRSLILPRTRDVMNYFQVYRQRCIDAGELQPLDRSAGREFGTTGSAPTSPQNADEIETRWNDYRNKPVELPDDEESRAKLFAQAVDRLRHELGEGLGISSHQSDRTIHVEMSNGSNDVDRYHVECCDRPAQNNSLAKQINALESAARENIGPVIPVALRSKEFPATPKTKISQTLGEFKKNGGKTIVVSDTDWRTMQSLINFVEENKHENSLSDWLIQSKPLSHLLSMRQSLDLDNRTPRTTPLPQSASKVEPPAKPYLVDPPAVENPMKTKPNGRLTVGAERSRQSGEVTLASEELKKHAAFLGSTGSGKTTAAMNLIEQLLLDGIPVVLLDRKGDLCRYADPAVWTESVLHPSVADRQEELRRAIDTVIYTPGKMAGRPLTLSVLPAGTRDLRSDDRTELAQLASRSLGAMLKYPPNGQGAQRIAVLAIALELLAEQIDSAVTLKDLVAYLREEDSDLINRLGMLDIKLVLKITQDLEALLINKAKLFSSEGIPLSADELLGRNSRNGKIRLSVVCPKFVGENPEIQFFAAQLLIEFERWTSKHPSNKLQAVLMLDEADIYLPAMSKPASKEPLESLLKRGRSAGLGIILATQSPGDLDYKCRDNIQTWFLGRIGEENALRKMKPVLSECKRNVSAELPAQKAGEFYLSQAGNVTPVKSLPAVVQTRQLGEDEIIRLTKGSQ